MARHGATSQKLVDLLKSDGEILKHLKSLSPSGVELEIMTLGTFEFEQANENLQNHNTVSNIVITYVHLVTDIPEKVA